MADAYLDPARPVRRRITLGLVVAGAVAGALIGVALTVLGKIVAGAPPATFENYRWNAIAFAAIAAGVTPLVTWSALRRVPFWRAVAEPLLGGVAGAAIGALLGSGAAFLLLAPIGAAAAVARLELTHRARPSAAAPLRELER